MPNLRRTLVARWDLEIPNRKEKAAETRVRIMGVETLGPDGDHRVRADDAKFQPPGQYKGIRLHPTPTLLLDY